MSADDRISIGATVRQRRLQRDPLIDALPLVALALPWVGHRETRSRGTVCGSIAHADPSAELPAVAVCLDATLVLESAHGRREVSASEFFTGAMTTVLGPDELLTQVRFPVAGSKEAYAFGEVARRHGDFALAGVAVRVVEDAAGRLGGRVTCFGVADRPVNFDVADLLDAVEVGEEPQLRRALRDPAQALAKEIVRTGDDDTHATRAYRIRLIAVLAAREVARAVARLRGR